MRAELAALDLPRVTPRRIWRGIYSVHVVFNTHDLLSYASSIAFQVLYAVAPLILLALGLLGIFHEQRLYIDHVAPRLRHDMSPDAFRVVDQSARHVMSGKKYYWTTAGLAITLWGISGSIRAMFVPLNRVYGAEETRPFWNRMLMSFVCAAIVMVSIYAAIALTLGGRLLHPPGLALSILVFVARWGLTLALVLLAIAAIVRLAPAKRLDVEWVSLGALLSAVSWIGASLLFGAYVRLVPYTSIYGVLAVLVVLLAYLYYSAVAFLFGIVVDRLLAEQVKSRGGTSRPGRRRRRAGTSGSRRATTRTRAR